MYRSVCGGSLLEVSGSFRLADWSRDTLSKICTLDTTKGKFLFVVCELNCHSLFLVFGLKPTEGTVTIYFSGIISKAFYCKK